MEIKFDEKGLIPAIIQDSERGEVLMLGYMNEESLQKTIKEGKVHFYSRSRKRIWMKGETSKNYLYVSSISKDCDGDSLLVLVRCDGNVCHTGNRSCFYEEIFSISSPPLFNFIHKLFDLIEERKKTREKNSYTSYLFEKGKELIAKKFGEEAVETIVAYLKEDSEKLKNEAVDMLYHFLVLLSSSHITPKMLMEELLNRFIRKEKEKR